MKVIKRKKVKPLLLAILAACLVVLIALSAIIIPILNKPADKPPLEPPEIIPGLEGIYNNSAVAIPYIPELDINLIRVRGNDTEYAFSRPIGDDGLTEGFLLYYTDNSGNLQVYYPAIGEDDPSFEYESLFAKETNDEYGTIYKLVYLCTAIGAPYFSERIEVSEWLEEREEQLANYGLATSDKPIELSFTYYAIEVAEDGTHLKGVDGKTIPVFERGVETTLVLDESGRPIPIYEKNADGTVKTDDDGKPVPAYEKDAEGNDILYGGKPIQRYERSEDSTIVLDIDGFPKRAEKTHYIKVGSQIINGIGYYFTVDDRNYVYASTNNYFGYAFNEFTSYINPVLVAAGLEKDGTFEPYLTTDFKQWKNTVYKNAGDIVTSESNVIITATTKTPTTTGVFAAGGSGYITTENEQISFNLAYYETNPSYRRMVNALLGAPVGAFSVARPVTMWTYTRMVDTESDKTYEYKISHIESILTDNGEITEAGALVEDNSKIKVSYTLRIDGELASYSAMHAVIDLADERISASVREALSEASVGELPNYVTFSVQYNKENTVERNAKKILSEIITIVDENGETADKVAVGTTVMYRYYITLDGERLDGDYTETLKIEKNMTGDNKTIADVLMGRAQTQNMSIFLVGYTEYCELFADFITYEIASIDYFVAREIITSFEFQQASDRDPYYGESIYKNTLTNDYRMYALNSASCELVVKLLGGVGQNTSSSVGYSGLETVAIGLTPDVMEKYGLYANTVYFELPRGITPKKYEDPDQTLNDYLNTLDDYTYYSTLGFTLYISDPDPITGNRYMASDLYDIVTLVDGESFFFLDYSFVEFYARRNVMLTDISNIKDMNFDFYMEDIYGSFNNELLHVPLYTYDGGVYTKSQLDDMELTEEQLAEATLYDGINVYVTPEGNCVSTKLTDMIAANAGYDKLSLWELFDKKYDGVDTMGTSAFKELTEMIFFTYYDGVLTKDEQTEALSSAPLLMRMTVTLGEAKDENSTSGIYVPTSSYDYVYEFYRISDRRVMVRVYSQHRTIENEIIAEVSDLYISTFSFKKIVAGYLGILNGKFIDNNATYDENLK